MEENRSKKASIPTFSIKRKYNMRSQRLKSTIIRKSLDSCHSPILQMRNPDQDFNSEKKTLMIPTSPFAPEKSYKDRRNKVYHLTLWFETIKNRKFDEKTEEMLNSGFSQLVNQVKTECKDRATLLINFFDLYKKFWKHEQNQKEAHLKGEIIELQKNIQLLRSAKNTQQADLNEEIEELKFSVNTQEVINNAKNQEINKLKDTISELNENLQKRPKFSEKITFRPLLNNTMRSDETTLLQHYFSDKSVQAIPNKSDKFSQSCSSQKPRAIQTEEKKAEVSEGLQISISYDTIYKFSQVVETQTEIGEELIMDQIIEFKQKILQKTDGEIARAKSKLLALENQIRRTHVPVITHTSPQISLCSVETQTEQNTSKALVQSETSKRRQHPAHTLIQNVLEKESEVERHHILSKNMMAKKINTIYQSALSREDATSPLSEYVYDYIQNKHQENYIGNKRFVELLSAALKNNEGPKTQVFLNLVGLGQEKYANLACSFSFYIALLNCMLRSKIGIVHAKHLCNYDTFVPKNRALECAREAFAKLNYSHGVSWLMASIEKAARFDFVRINCNGIVSLDHVMSLAMSKYDEYCRDVIAGVLEVTTAFGVLNNEEVNTELFVWVARALAPEFIENIVSGDDLTDAVMNIRNPDSLQLPIDRVIDFCIKNAMLSKTCVHNYVENSMVYKQWNSVDCFISKSSADLQRMSEASLGLQEIWKQTVKKFYEEGGKFSKALSIAILIDEIARLDSLIE